MCKRHTSHRTHKKCKNARESEAHFDMMNEKAAAARRAYKRQWAKANPDKVRAAQERYWTKQAAQAEQMAKTATTAQEGGRTGT